MVPLNWYLVLAAFIFSCGLYAALKAAQRHRGADGD